MNALLCSPKFRIINLVIDEAMVLSLIYLILFSVYFIHFTDFAFSIIHYTYRHIQAMKWQPVQVDTFLWLNFFILNEIKDKEKC